MDGRKEGRKAESKGGRMKSRETKEMIESNRFSARAGGLRAQALGLGRKDGQRKRESSQTLRENQCQK